MPGKTDDLVTAIHTRLQSRVDVLFVISSGYNSQLVPAKAGMVLVD